MDLSTLSSLLESHSATITSLYSQLGASPSTVPAKLEELHAALISTVNSQREEAEQELNQVRTRVDELRGVCERKRKRLGESRTSTAVGEESLLDARKRLEQEHAATDKLVEARQKQFDDVKSRLEVFVPVLGRETVFVDDRAGDTPSEADLSLARLSRLQKEVTRCQNEVRHREEQLQSLLRDILELWNDLGLCPSEEDACTSANAEKHQLDLQVLRALGGTVPHENIPALTAREETLQALIRRKDGLEAERERRMLEIQNLYDELYPLWNKLGVSDEEADEFVELWKGTEDKCLQAYRDELARMLQVKAENVVVFIAKEREEIAGLWDALFYSEEERRAFALYDSDSSDEDILQAHEEEKRKLVGELESKQHVLSKLSKYFELLDEIRQLEESANDPSRLTGKGPRGDPGRLLREEKMRKRIAKVKPQLEQGLLDLIPIWEQEHNQPFLINGSRFVEDLASRVEMEQASKGAKRTKAAPAAPGSRPERAAQPLKRQMTGASASSGTSAASTTIKRARTNTMTSSAAPCQRPMLTGASTAHYSHSNVLATPCPPSSLQLHTTSSDLQLVQSAKTMAGSRLPAAGTRLPLKAQTAGQAHATNRVQPPAQPLSTLTKTSTASMRAGQPQKQSFRPRPSILSHAGSLTSVSSASTWGMRTASSAASIDSVE